MSVDRAGDRIDVRMGNLGYDEASGKIARWLKAVGDTVERGEPLLEVETDKATIEMESLEAGTLVAIIHGDGADVPVGDVIGVVERRA